MNNEEKKKKKKTSHHLMPTYTNSGASGTADHVALLRLFYLQFSILLPDLWMIVRSTTKNRFVAEPDNQHFDLNIFFIASFHSLSLFLVECYASQNPALSVRPSVRPSVRLSVTHFFYSAKMEEYGQKWLSTSPQAFSFNLPILICLSISLIIFLSQSFF